MPGWLRIAVEAVVLILSIVFALGIGEWNHLVAAAAGVAIALVWLGIRAKTVRVRRWEERRADAEQYDAVWSNPDAFSGEQRSAAAEGRIPPR